MEEELRDRLRDMLERLGCPDTAADAVMDVIAPIVAERDQLRAVVEYAEAQRARQRQRSTSCRKRNVDCGRPFATSEAADLGTLRAETSTISATRRAPRTFPKPRA